MHLLKHLARLYTNIHTHSNTKYSIYPHCFHLYITTPPYIHIYIVVILFPIYTHHIYWSVKSLRCVRHFPVSIPSLISLLSKLTPPHTSRPLNYVPTRKYYQTNSNRGQTSSVAYADEAEITRKPN